MKLKKNKRKIRFFTKNEYEQFKNDEYKKILNSNLIESKQIKNKNKEVIETLYKYDIEYIQYTSINYNDLIIKLIRERYSLNDELAILRQQSIKKDEFNEYNLFVEECKQKAKNYMEEISKK